jgi:hypothetical protein
MRIVTQLRKPLLMLDAHNGARRVANNRIGIGLEAANSADFRGARDNHQVGLCFSAAERTTFGYASAVDVNAGVGRAARLCHYRFGRRELATQLHASYFDDAGRRAGHSRSQSRPAQACLLLAVDILIEGIVNPVVVMEAHVIANEPPQISFVWRDDGRESLGGSFPPSVPQSVTPNWQEFDGACTAIACLLLGFLHAASSSCCSSAFCQLELGLYSFIALARPSVLLPRSF